MFALCDSSCLSDFCEFGFALNKKYTNLTEQNITHGRMSAHVNSLMKTDVECVQLYAIKLLLLWLNDHASEL